MSIIKIFFLTLITALTCACKRSCPPKSNDLSRFELSGLVKTIVDTTFSSQNAIESIDSTCFNKKGELTFHAQTYCDGCLYNYSLEKQENIVLYYSYSNPIDTLHHFYIERYHSNTLPQEFIRYAPDSIILGRELYTYSKDSIDVLIDNYDFKNKLTRHTQSTYQQICSSRLLIRSEHYDRNQKKEHTVIYTYDKRGNLISKKSYTINDICFNTILNTYNLESQKTASKTYQQDSNAFFLTEYQYNTAGNIISKLSKEIIKKRKNKIWLTMIKSTSINTYSYIYDHHNNWVQKRSNPQHGSYNYHKRKITYY